MTSPLWLLTADFCLSRDTVTGKFRPMAEVMGPNWCDKMDKIEGKAEMEKEEKEEEGGKEKEEEGGKEDSSEDSSEDTSDQQISSASKTSNPGKAAKTSKATKTSKAKRTSKATLFRKAPKKVSAEDSFDSSPSE